MTDLAAPASATGSRGVSALEQRLVAAELAALDWELSRPPHSPTPQGRSRAGR